MVGDFDLEILVIEESFKFEDLNIFKIFEFGLS